MQGLGLNHFQYLVSYSLKAQNVLVFPNGRGEGGRVVKLDLANCSVRPMFPEADGAEVLRMLNDIMGCKRSIWLEILEIVAAWDAKNKEDGMWKPMRKQATEELRKKFMKEGADEEKRPPRRRKARQLVISSGYLKQTSTRYWQNCSGELLYTLHKHNSK